MKSWPVPYRELTVPSRFGITHVVVSGATDAAPLVLLHGYMATLTMWAPNVADFSKRYRVYAIDVMGQPGKSIPGEPIRQAADYVEWLTATLDALHLDRVSLVGMSYGGWLALNVARAAPERVQRLVLLSPAASLLPIVRQFSLRGMLMLFLPIRLTVSSFMRWLGIADTSAIELMCLGLKHFRIPRETSRVTPTVFSDDQLRAMRIPTLLLMGDHEVIYDPEKALARARRLIPDIRGELIPSSNHDMCFSQHRIVDARVLDFLDENRRSVAERVVA
jgi:pimeloyl-ACP methyl ester carboxylesterase